MNSARFVVADVFDGLATLEDGSVDLVVTSPPFLALRSYLPADHPDKTKEIGSEPTPAAWLDVMLAVYAELRRVVAEHGSVCFEVGDTYAGSGGAGGDYAESGNRHSQPEFAGSEELARRYQGAIKVAKEGTSQRLQSGDGWPLAKSKALIPQLLEIALAYGINPLTGKESPAGRWRIRNVVTWARPNPPVGALGDKWRPATSDVIVACVSGKRYWDDLATRRPVQHPLKSATTAFDEGGDRRRKLNPYDSETQSANGAPLLDYWEIPPGGYKGSHYAVFPPDLVVPLVKAMCPEKVCRECGEPSRRVLKQENASEERRALAEHIKSQRETAGLSQKDLAVHFPSASGGVTGCVWNWENAANVPTAEQWPILVDLLDLSDEFAYLIEGTRQWTESLIEYEDVSDHPSGWTQDANGRVYQRLDSRKNRIHPEEQWTDCGHDDYRPGIVLDPFAGSGTTLEVAVKWGRDAIGFDLDERNADLARERVGDSLFHELVVVRGGVT